MTLVRAGSIKFDKISSANLKFGGARDASTVAILMLGFSFLALESLRLDGDTSVRAQLIDTSTQRYRPQRGACTVACWSYDAPRAPASCARARPIAFDQNGFQNHWASVLEDAEGSEGRSAHSVVCGIAWVGAV